MTCKKYSFFESYHKALSRVSDERYGRVVRAMSEFAFIGVEPNFVDDADWVVWELIHPIIARGQEISEARADAGRKGKGVSRNTGNSHAVKEPDTQNQNKTIQNNTKQNGKGIGYGMGKGNNKESTIVPKKNISLPISERMKKFQNELSPYLGKYGKDMLNDFYEYWAEPDRKGNKMRCELEKTWNLSSRLSRWQRRGNNGKSC